MGRSLGARLTASILDTLVLPEEAEFEPRLATVDFDAFRDHCWIVGEQGPQPMEDWGFFLDNPMFGSDGWTLPRVLSEGQSAVVVKGRQVGISWYVGSYILWRATFGQEGGFYQLFSQSEREAKKLFAKIRYMYDRLGPVQRPPARPPTMLELQIAGGGELVVFPSTEDAGRGDTSKVAFWDEAAKHKFARETYAAVSPQAEQLLQITTSSGGHIPTSPDQISDIGDFIANRYWAAHFGEIPGTHGLMYPWWVRPRRYDRAAGEWTDIHRNRHADCGGLRTRGDGSLESWEDRPCVAPGYEQHGCLGFEINWDWWRAEQKGFVGAAFEFLREHPRHAVDAFSSGAGTLWYPEYNDGTMAVDEPPFPWRSAKLRLMGVDYGGGGGDPTAVLALGVSGTGHVHQFGELYSKDVVTLYEIRDYILKCHAQGPVFAVCPDPSERTTNNTLRLMLAPYGIRVIDSDNDRSHWTLLTEKLKATPAKFSIDRRCKGSRHEFVVYTRSVKRHPNTGEKYVGKRTVDQHGDAMDARRYCLAFLKQLETAPGVQVGTLDGRALARDRDLPRGKRAWDAQRGRFARTLPERIPMATG